MKKHLTLIFLILGIAAGTIHANTPPAKSVMLVNQYLDWWGSKRSPGNWYKHLNEWVECGMNVAHFPMYGKGDKDYTVAEKVNDAHEYGLYVCGAVWTRDGNATMEQMIEVAAGVGCDYAVIEEPYTDDCSAPRAGTFTADDYLKLKTIGNTAKLVDNFPIIINDAFCNANFASINTDGLYSEMYAPAWGTTTFTHMNNYKAANPGKFVGCYIWLKTDDLSTIPSTNLSYTYFESWFSTVWNGVGNVSLYQWDRNGPGNADVGYGSDWNHRGPYITKTTGKGESIPTWSNFAITGPTDVQIQVKSASTGLDPASVQCYYQAESMRWVKYNKVSATGTSGTKDWVTITAKGLPAGRVKFKIKDVYSGNYFRGPRTWKTSQSFAHTGSRWSAIQGTQTVKKLVTNSLTASFKFTIQDTTDGLDVTSLTCEFSTDGGTTWQEHATKITGSAGTKGNEIVTVKEIPFKDDKPGVNKLRLSIKTTAEYVLSTEEYAVNVQLPPAFAKINTTSGASGNYDFSVSAEDSKGVILGSQDVPVRDNAVVLYHFNGDVKDASGNGQDGKLYGNAKLEEVDSWKSSGGKESVLSLDGVNSFVNFGHGYLGRTVEFTISAWLNAGNSNTPIILGEHEGAGSLEIMPLSNRIKIQVFSNPRTAFPALNSQAGSFSNNEWHHVTVTFDGLNGRLYIDGNLAAEEDWGGYKIYAYKPLMMGRPSNRSRYFKGYIDEFQIIGTALSAAEVASNYFSGAYKVSSDGGDTWSEWTKSELNGTGASAASAKFSLKGIKFTSQVDSVNRVQIAARDEYGHTGVQEYALTADDFVSVEASVNTVTGLTLYPNPFKTKVTMTFNLEAAQSVQLDIYSIDGMVVKSLGENKLSAGKNGLSWNGTDNNGNLLPAGQYFARVKVGNQVMVKKLMMLR
ncbi:MAG: T9SS type A sorting domain-containing protein [Fibrobacteria bacterium]|nr:T9SS type A sorting domain-containing protein [Fibrobacteria bacterium]